jgi:hypothetical protein
MVHSCWAPWAAGAALTLAATVATAAPLPVVPVDATAPRTLVGPVQYYYGHPYRPYYAPPPPPPVYYYGRPRRAPVYGYPPYGYYNKEAAKNYVKGYRQGQKEILKDRARAWNRANGF